MVTCMALEAAWLSEANERTIAPSSSSDRNIPFDGPMKSIREDLIMKSLTCLFGNLLYRGQRTKVLRFHGEHRIKLAAKIF